MLKTVTLLGVSVTDENPEKVLEYVFSVVGKGKEQVFITTPNPEILVYANGHSDYKDKLNSSQVALPDGVGLVIGSYLLGKPLRHRITGVDFIEMACHATREKPMSIGFLGGRGGVAEKAALRLLRKYTWLEIVFIGEEWGESGFKKAEVFGMKYMVYGKKEKIQHMTYNIQNTTIDILFVAYGFPKQEEWIYENLPHLPVKAAMGVGGAFDYLSGSIPRAPKVLRMIGLEWLFRLFVQPWRWRRQLSLFTFLFLVFKERFSKSH
ncbi:MAG TPA: WecB/TagA/CpsF family glycosyltransferase [Patescibacteria group bacterium]|nr:WecB/TagA/CpsF family glycosyltransferase [Patescibacteria group bacterium]